MKKVKLKTLKKGKPRRKQLAALNDSLDAGLIYHANVKSTECSKCFLIAFQMTAKCLNSLKSYKAAQL